MLHQQFCKMAASQITLLRAIPTSREMTGGILGLDLATIHRVDAWRHSGPGAGGSWQPYMGMMTGGILGSRILRLELAATHSVTTGLELAAIHRGDHWRDSGAEASSYT